MFQFTTTNVINSNKDLTTGKPLWSAQAKTDERPASFHVKRVNKFLAPNVVAIYKAEAHDAENAKATIDLSQVNGKDGDTFRLHIYVGLSQASQSSLYANDLQEKGKPFSVDFVWESSAADTVNKLVKTINKYAAMVYNKKLLNVIGSGTYITIEATDEYQRFKFINIEKFNAAAYHGMGDYTVVRSLDNLPEVEYNEGVTTNSEGYFVGREGFGTYPFLLHNLRIPTSARTRWTAINQDETPILGAKYNQYTIHYCVNRGILGNNAVGDIVKSQTTHVFYVRWDLAAEFEAALTVIAPEGGIIPVRYTNRNKAQTKAKLLNIAANGGNIRLDNDVDLDKELNISAQKSVNIDLNGKTIRNKKTDGGVAIDVQGELTIDGHGQVQGGSGGNNQAIHVGAAGKLVINGGTYGVGVDASNEGNSCIETAGGPVEINGGVFSSKKDWNGHYYVLNIKDSARNVAKVIVKGGTFINYNPADGDPGHESDHKSFVAPGYESVEIPAGSNIFVVRKQKAKSV